MTGRRSTCVRGALGLVLLAAICAPASASAADAALCDSVEATIVGTDGPDELVGLPGVDVVAGLGGDDRISGDLAGDRVCGGDGDDTILSPVELIAFGGPGDDHLEVAGTEGKRDNKAELYGNEGNDTIVSAVELTAFGGPGNDHLEALDEQGGGILRPHRFYLYGDDGDDVVVAGTMDAGSTTAGLHGGNGDDTLLSGPSDYDSFLYPGLGRDVVDGGGGNAMVLFEPDAGPVQVNLARGVATGQGRDTLTGIDKISATPYADRLIGDDAPNTIFSTCFTGTERDVVHGRGGDDVLSRSCGGTVIGGRGDDEIEVSGGDTPTDDDYFDGGAGYDWITFSSNGQPVTVDLEAGTISAPGIGTDAVSRIEAVHGGAGDDTLRGDDADNQLDGGNGEDLLDGRGGDDYLLGHIDEDALFGGEGDDLLDGGGATNTLDGGPGNDTCYNGAATNCER